MLLRIVHLDLDTSAQEVLELAVVIIFIVVAVVFQLDIHLMVSVIHKYVVGLQHISLVTLMPLMVTIILMPITLKELVSLVGLLVNMSGHSCHRIMKPLTGVLVYPVVPHLLVHSWVIIISVSLAIQTVAGADPSTQLIHSGMVKIAVLMKLLAAMVSHGFTETMVAPLALKVLS